MGSTASTIGIVAGGSTINTIVFGAGQSSQAVTLNSGGGTITLGGTAPSATPTISALNTSNTIAAVLVGTAGLTFNGPGILTLAGAETYTGTTIVSAGGTLNIGNGTSGNLNNTTPSALTFNAGAGVFNRVAASTGSSQSMGALTFSAGEGTVQSTYGASGNAFLTFSSLAARTAGAAGNFIVSGGSIGSNNKIVLTTGATAGTLLDKGLFFGGADYAAYDAGGYVRAFNYTTPDAGGVDLNLSGDQATLGTISATTQLQLRGTGNITGQTGGQLNTLKISGSHTLTLVGQLQELGILQTGGSSDITGGNLKANATGGEIVIRVDQASDALNISSPILLNGSASLTKSGAGTLTLSGANTYTGTTTINAGTLALSGGSAMDDAGAVALANVPGATLLLNNNETIGNLSGGGLFGGNVNVQGNTLTLGDANHKTFGGLFIGTSGGAIIKQGTGTLTLSGKNTFAGTITLNLGQLVLAYGSDGTASTPTVSSGGTISMANGTSLLVNPTAQVAAGVAVGALGGSVSVGNVVSNPIIITSGTASIKQTTQGSPRYIFSGGVTGGTSGAQTLSIIQGAGGGNAERTTITVSGIIQDGSGGPLGVSADFLSASTAGQGAFICLSGQNTFTGPIIVNNTKGLLYNDGTAYHGAWFVIGGEITSGFSDRTVTPGTGYLGGGNYTNTITLATGTILNYLSSTNQTLSGVISGSGNVVKEGSGTLTLSANNTYSGMTTVSAGKFFGVVGGSCSNSAVLVSSGTFGISVTDTNTNWICKALTHSAASTLEFAFGANTPSTIVAPLQVNGNVAFSVVPSVSCTGSSLPAGAYPLMTWTGALFGVPPSTLILPSGTGLLFVDNATKTLWVSISVSGSSKQPLTWKGAGDKIWIANETVYTKWQDAALVNTNYQETTVNEITVGDNVVFGTTGAGTVTLNTTVSPASVSVNSTANYTFSGTGSIAGPGGLTKTGSGTLMLSTTNSYSGGTLLSAGILTVAADNALGTGPLVLGAATIQSSDTTARTLNNAVVLNGSTIIGGTGSLTFNNSGTGTVNAASTITVNSGSVNATFGTSFSGAGSITKAGAGTMTLSGTNTYGGTTTISGGSLVIDGGTTSSGVVSFTGNNTSMSITNGGTLNSTGNSNIGADSVSNIRVSVVGGNGMTAIWNLGNGKLGIYGYSPEKANKVLTIDGVGFAGSAAVNNINTLEWGRSTYNSALLVTNGGQLSVNGDVQIGSTYYGLGGTNNTIAIGGGTADSIMTVGQDYYIGYGDRAGPSFNTTTVNAGGQLNITRHMYIGNIGNTQNGDYNSTGNKLVVTGGGTASMNQLSLGYVSVNQSGQNRRSTANVVEVTNGGKLSTTGTSYIGRANNADSIANNNTVTVSGTNSRWTAGNQNVYVGYTGNGTAVSTGNVLTVVGGSVVTNISALIVKAANTLSLGAGGLIYAGAVTNSGTMAVALDKTVTPVSGRLSVAGNLNVNNARLDVSISGTPDGAYVIASYGNLIGTFAATNGLPDKYRLDMEYKGNQIAIVYTAAGTMISFQ